MILNYISIQLRWWGIVNTIASCFTKEHNNFTYWKRKMRNYKLIDAVTNRYYKAKKQYDTVNNRLCNLQNELQFLKTMYVKSFKEKLQELQECKTDYIKINKEYTDVKRLYDDPCLGCTMEACLPVDEDGNCPAFRGYINHAALERMYDND